ncbi:strawberry notch-like protein [Striga asiatica]|uniref:Strawberry notch-like protein n=1 Tax=Striga asiatica TaxID=4170 RepID=A0A5A7QJ51_STRAF|nr:strawberry notch-like protein [Striga asiatica]
MDKPWDDMLPINDFMETELFEFHLKTSSLSALQPPEPTYDLKIKDDLGNSEALSCLQIEVLVSACHVRDTFSTFQVLLLAGFFLGDGAGVGKGRAIAGLILENWHHGRRKVVWISVWSDLEFNARRDLDDVGASCIEVEKYKENAGKLGNKRKRNENPLLTKRSTKRDTKSAQIALEPGTLGKSRLGGGQRTAAPEMGTEMSHSRVKRKSEQKKYCSQGRRWVRVPQMHRKCHLGTPDRSFTTKMKLESKYLFLGLGFVKCRAAL